MNWLLYYKVSLRMSARSKRYDKNIIDTRTKKMNMRMKNILDGEIENYINYFDKQRTINSERLPKDIYKVIGTIYK